MEWIDTLMGVIGYSLAGLFGLVALAAVFGTRIETKWDYEAKFRDERGRELGEFDVELKRLVKEGAEWTLSVVFELKHPALVAGSTVEVWLADELVMRSAVETAGRIRLGASDLLADLKSPRAGQICSVRIDDAELFAEALYRD